MARKLILILLVLILGFSWLQDIDFLRADELADIEKELGDLQNAYELSVAATTPLESEVESLDQKLRNIQLAIGRAEGQLAELEQSIFDREVDLEFQITLMGQRVRSWYVSSQRYSPLSIFLSSSSSLGDLTRDLSYRQAAADQDKRIILQVAEQLRQLGEDKKQVEEDKVRLAAVKTEADRQATFLRGEIAKAKDYQTILSKQIAELSARQQAILTERTGTFQTSVGDVPLADDPASRPDYNPGFSPAFAAFSFGAPHFKGMSQYGAYGRAKSGQSAEDILRAYYGGGIEIKKDYSKDIVITVEGYGAFNIEEYVKRIYEMPGSWTDNDSAALKAQAVAARSYALARTNNGAGSICATEACQVFKPNPKGGAWDAAVNATAGWVLMANGQPFSAWYASTSGGYQESYSFNGYSTPGFWDTPSGRGGWTSEAYEKKAESPWFYKGWYRSRSGDTCGRSHPWLTSEEMADILNAWKVLFEGGGDSSRVTPTGPCWGDNPYSEGELRIVGGFTSVAGVSVTYGTNGVTAQVSFDTNKGTVNVNGLDFKKAFNLRAPGRISLKSGLFNIEKK